MKPNKVFFSVIAATHFRADKLQALINSLNNQTFPFDNFEIIIIPSPSDPAFAIKNELIINCKPELFIQDIPSDPHQGRGVAQKRNFGASMARGKWLAFIDDDCVADINWLKATYEYISNGAQNLAAIEGNTKIPPVEKTTFTSKTLVHLSRPNGFQTCNIFYRQDIFQKLKGFSEDFPWFLEDTEIAWNFIHHGYEIPWSQSSIVFHPAGVQEKMSRIMHEAKNSYLKLLLYKRYPEVYQRFGMKIMRWTHWAYLPFWGLILLSTFLANWTFITISFALLVLFSSFHTWYWMRNCTNPFSDYISMSYHNAVAPLVILWVNLINSRHYKISVSRLFLLLTNANLNKSSIITL